MDVMRAFPVATAAERGKCGQCPGSICCTYITQQIPTPRARADFEHMLWQVSHDGIEIYKDEDGWYLLVHAPCHHLQTNGACGIYDERPPVCRAYSNDFCELDEPAEKHFALHFRTYEELLGHYRKRFPRRR
ncbi:MAG: YkgJ family cysteine cluster protein [Gammaproteobacteria bacterium]|nr:YkgJ family cysteine cluster protein [Gammaproteobacteria bacterium]